MAYVPKSKRQLKEPGISGKCHTLTADEYFVLSKLDDFARMYHRQYANLMWLARVYQDQKDREEGHWVSSRFSRVRMTLLKENIDKTREILRGLWRKGLVEPHTLHVKTTNGVEFVTPETKTEAFKEEEKWRVTIAGTDCANPPAKVRDCIREHMEHEQKTRDKITIMKAWRECWEKHEK